MKTSPTVPDARLFENLGVFYLGRRFDPAADAIAADLVLYDAKDLTTHAVCVGMTGSGKTGLCVSLLEEAALDGIPALVIDPKGDLVNLALTFPGLAPDDFRPWIDEAEAARKDMTPDAYAEQVARTWREGLAGWGQGPDRIERLRAAAEVAVYTPGSTAGRPLTVLRSLAAPPPGTREDADALCERVGAAVAGLLALLGIDADPVRSREHVLLATILQNAWQEYRDMGMAELVAQVQSPPFPMVGVMPVDTFFPPADRIDLAMRINGLLASPGFAAWLDGEPLDIPKLLWALAAGHGEPPGGALHGRGLRLLPALGQPAVQNAHAHAAQAGAGVRRGSRPGDAEPGGPRLQGARQRRHGVPRKAPDGARQAACARRSRRGFGERRRRVRSGPHGADPGRSQEPRVPHAQRARGRARPAPHAMGHVVPPRAAHPGADPAVGGSTTPGGASCGPAPAARPSTVPTKAPAMASGPRPAVPPQAGESFVVPTSPPPVGRRLLYRPALLGVADLHFVSAKDGVDEWQAARLPRRVGRGRRGRTVGRHDPARYGGDQ